MEQLYGLGHRATGVMLASRPVIARPGRTVMLGADHGADRCGWQRNQAAENGLKHKRVERDHRDDRAALDHPWQASAHRRIYGRVPGTVNRPACGVHTCAHRRVDRSHYKRAQCYNVSKIQRLAIDYQPKRGDCSTVKVPAGRRLVG
jgi:hypothetical protein